MNSADCGLYCISNAERLSNLKVQRTKTGFALRMCYLTTLMDLAFRSSHEVYFRKIVQGNQCLKGIERVHRIEEDDSIQSLKRRRSPEWEPPKANMDKPPERWEEQRESLTLAFQDSFPKAESQRRAEHLLRMVYSVASKEVISAWESSPRPPSVGSQGISNSSTALAIYNLVTLGQSRAFYDSVLLRVGKYLLASRIAKKVEELRKDGSPSKQRVSVAGSKGEGNAVSRALKGFVGEVVKDPNLGNVEFHRCKQWWNEGKICF